MLMIAIAAYRRRWSPKRFGDADGDVRLGLLLPAYMPRDLPLGEQDPDGRWAMTGIRPPSVGTLRAYRQSTYRAGGMVARIGFRPTGLGAQRAGAKFVLIGASNPGGRRRPDAWNARMTERLRLRLRHCCFIEATGSLGQWSEAMFMATMDPRRATTLALRFGQNAIVVIRGNGRARLKLL